MSTAPKLTRILWPKGPFATTSEWLTSLAPPKPPPSEPPADPKRPSAAGSEMGGGMQPPTPERWARW